MRVKTLLFIWPLLGCFSAFKVLLAGLFHNPSWDLRSGTRKKCPSCDSTVLLLRVSYAEASSSPALLMMYSAHKLNKQGGNIQPWHTPFPIWNQSVFPCAALTVASRPAYRFLKRQVRWSGIPISFRISHSLLWSTRVSYTSTQFWH